MRVEFPTILLIVLCYGLWLAAGGLVFSFSPLLALAVMAVCAALHSSLVHECLHGHPTRHDGLNELLVALPLALVFPYRRFKATHLAHHKDAHLTDPFDDPESYYHALWRHRGLPVWMRALLRINNTLAGRLLIGPILQCVGFVMSETPRLWRGERGIRTAWALHFAGLVPVLWMVSAMGVPLWLYLLAVVWPSMSIIALRTFAEHQWHETPQGRTIIVEKSVFSILFLNNNLHIVHHTHPSAPWYDLPRLYRSERSHWHEVNHGYVFANYYDLWRRWGFKSKEPVVHPVLHREPLADSTGA